jgi:predicted transcriptional regulator
MTTLTITLTDDCLSRLEEKATKLGVSPEALVRASIEGLLTEPDETVRSAVEDVLKKNAELYRRFA